MWFGWGFWMLGPICLVLLAIGASFLITSNWGCPYYPASETTTTTSKRALEIVKTRYAKGEITREQFIEMRKELE